MDKSLFKGDPLKGTKWDNLTFAKYNDMSDDERVEFKEYIESIYAPFSSDIDDDINEEGNYKTWRDIVSMQDEELNEMNTELLNEDTIMEQSASNETTEMDANSAINSDNYDMDDAIDTPF